MSLSDIRVRATLKGTIFRGGGGGGVTSYDQLNDKPSINGVTIEGALDGNDYGLANTSDLIITAYNTVPGESIYRLHDVTIEGRNYTVAYLPFEGTDGIDNGKVGLVPAPTAADAGKVLFGDGTWKNITGIKVVKLYNNYITNVGTYTLNESIENYDFILFITAYRMGSGTPVVGSNIAPTDYIRTIYTNDNTNYSVWIGGGNNDRSSSIVFHSATEIYASKASIEDSIIGIYGIKI